MYIASISARSRRKKGRGSRNKSWKAGRRLWERRCLATGANRLRRNICSGRAMPFASGISGCLSAKSTSLPARKACWSLLRSRHAAPCALGVRQQRWAGRSSSASSAPLHGICRESSSHPPVGLMSSKSIAPRRAAGRYSSWKMRLRYKGDRNEDYHRNYRSQRQHLCAASP